MTTHTDVAVHSEPEKLARKIFVATLIGALAFITTVLLVVRYMPSNEGPIEAPVLIPATLATR